MSTEPNNVQPVEKGYTRTIMPKPMADRYEDDYRWKPARPDDPFTAKSTVDMLNAMDANPNIELESRIISVNEADGRYGFQNFNRRQFVDRFIEGDKTPNKFRFKEWDQFSVTSGLGNGGAQGGAPVGDDFIPLLGGPFYKNLYYYTDYLRMHVECFYAYHHDPIAKALIAITRDFVLGTGFEVQVTEDGPDAEMAMTVWKAFEKVNNIHQLMDEMCTELSIYGENLIYWLPNNEAKIVYDLAPKDTIPYGIIPRVRLIDPSNMVEIVTYPEDITRVLFYVWLTPTQYQIYTSGLGSTQTQGQPTQPTLKYIYQQILAKDIKHYKINAVSNEKRGRSDLFPVLSYLKRLRDSVNYSLISLEKNSAWSMDTTIKGNQDDINNYIASQAALGTIPPAGSEFVHTDAITRNYMGNGNIGGGVSNAFDWCISMICAGMQIPVNFLGTHLSGSSTRASALVATEPVIKKMEKRRQVMSRILVDMWDELMKRTGNPKLRAVKCKVIFPEMITQDRSQKLQDLALAEDKKWFSRERCAMDAAKELQQDNFDYNAEQQKIKAELPLAPAAPENPLTAPGQNQDGSSLPKSSAITNNDRKEITSNGLQL